MSGFLLFLAGLAIILAGRAIFAFLAGVALWFIGLVLGMAATCLVFQAAGLEIHPLAAGLLGMIVALGLTLALGGLARDILATLGWFLAGLLLILPVLPPALAIGGGWVALATLGASLWFPALRSALLGTALVLLATGPIHPVATWVLLAVAVALAFWAEGDRRSSGAARLIPDLLRGRPARRDSIFFFRSSAAARAFHARLSRRGFHPELLVGNAVYASLPAAEHLRTVSIFGSQLGPIRWVRDAHGPVRLPEVQALSSAASIPTSEVRRRSRTYDDASLPDSLLVGENLRITVGILGTGINLEADTAPWIEKRISFVENEEDILDDLNGHETGVFRCWLEMVRGQDPSSLRVTSIRVLDENGEGTLLSVLRGMTWAAHEGLDIVSMSLGALICGGADGGSDELCLTAREMKDVLVVAAAGNDGEPGTISCPGAADGVLTVGSIDADYQVSYFSSRGPTADGRSKPDLVSFGENILIPGSYGRPISGTSFATPFVAGLLSLAMLMHRTVAQPYRDRRKYFDVLRRASIAVEPMNPNDTGAGLPNLVLVAREVGFPVGSPAPAPAPTRGRRSRTRAA